MGFLDGVVTLRNICKVTPKALTVTDSVDASGWKIIPLLSRIRISLKAGGNHP